MRYLCYVTLGFAAACALCAYVFGSFFAASIGFLILFLLFLWLSHMRGISKIPALIFAGMAAGFFWFSLFDSLYLKPADSFHGETVRGCVTLTDYPREALNGCSAEGVLFLEGKPYRVRCYFSHPQRFTPGDQVRGSFRLRSTLEENRGKTEFFRDQEIFFRIYPEGEVHREQAPQDLLWTAPARMGKYAETTIHRCFSEKTAPFAASLLLGDGNRLDFKTDWNLRISGIRHLVAVSGLHVSVLFALVGALSFHRRWLGAVLGLPILFFFGAMTGFTPSVFRACIMMTLMILSQLVKRDYDPLTSLSAAVLLMLGLNPLTITSVSFQLSAASVAGILLYMKPLENWLLRRFPGGKGIRHSLALWFCGSVALSLSSLVFVTPLAAFYFGSISLAAPITNLLTVWLVPFLFWGILGVVALSFLSIGAARMLAIPVGLGIRYVLGVSEILAGFPLSAVFTKSLPMVIWIVSVYLLGAVFLLGRRKRVYRFLELSIGGLCLAFCLSWGIPRLNSFSMTAVDVGQGQCIFLRSQGKNFMVDCGGTRDRDAAIQAAETMMSQGFFKLDGLILSHYDRDHVGGAPYLLSLVSADRIYLPPGESLPADSRIRLIKDHLKLSYRDTVLTIFGGEREQVTNEMSLCVLLDSPEYDILIVGDRNEAGEQALLSDFEIPTVDCLVAGHHGAGDSTSQELLEAVRPETVVISVGKYNTYGHPGAQALLRLQKFGCRILRTDLLGSITIRR